MRSLYKSQLPIFANDPPLASDRKVAFVRGRSCRPSARTALSTYFPSGRCYRQSNNRQALEVQAVRVPARHARARAHPVVEAVKVQPESATSLS